EARSDPTRQADAVEAAEHARVAAPLAAEHDVEAALAILDLDGERTDEDVVAASAVGQVVVVAAEEVAAEAPVLRLDAAGEVHVAEDVGFAREAVLVGHDRV